MSGLQFPMRRREFLARATRSTVAIAASLGMGSAVLPRFVRADESGPARTSRISYYCNGEIHVNEVGQSEGKPVTTGHWDFKPSWSKTGDMLVCFRRLKDDPVTVKWKTAIFVVHVDGSGFQQLSDGTHTDFNPTWTRDDRNAPIWNRKNPATGGFIVMQGKVGGKPGQEVALSDAVYHTWAHSCLTDGRILVNAHHPTQGWGVFLMHCKEGAKPLFERVRWELDAEGQMHRASISPSEKKICFEFLRGQDFTEPGHTLYIADFDAQQRSLTNLKAIANAEGKPHWYAYPRWINGESAVVYHLNSTGKGQLFVYQLEDGVTKRVSTNPNADYRYPHGEAAPC
ncbi:MAG: hypothetical protein FJ276_09535 [Planctomycetes bacterium]|nr:hypothetical protein [Planctomycetota bacterium]